MFGNLAHNAMSISLATSIHSYLLERLGTPQVTPPKLPQAI